MWQKTMFVLLLTIRERRGVEESEKIDTQFLDQLEITENVQSTIILDSKCQKTSIWKPETINFSLRYL